MIYKQKRLKQLITRCNKRLDIAISMSLTTNSAEDYTFEYAVSDLLYDASIVKRALNETSDEIELLFENTKNIISHFDEKLWPRLIKLHKAHFSIDEFERQLILVQSALNDKSENHLWESSLNELVERKDKLDLFADSNSFLSDCLKSFTKRNLIFKCRLTEN